MGDTGDMYRAMGEKRKALRRKYGLECPMCISLHPKRNPSILLPGQQCRVCDYRDPRDKSVMTADESQ